MYKKINSAFISVFNKEGLNGLIKALSDSGVKIYSTGGTQKFIENLGYGVVPIEELTNFPSILGGRVKSLHPSIFGGILARRDNESDKLELNRYQIPLIDLVIVDLYPFRETLATTDDEKQIIEKIDIGGPSLIRAAAKNFTDVTVIASKEDYEPILNLFIRQSGSFSLEQRKQMAAKAFKVVAEYDIVINDYFNPSHSFPLPKSGRTILRYGENPHQKAWFSGDFSDHFIQISGKEISYNNLVDIDAALQLISEWDSDKSIFAIIKHTNVCGIAKRNTVLEAWKAAHDGDPESAFGGVLICNQEIDASTANIIKELFFEVLITPIFTPEALEILKSKKNRILLVLKKQAVANESYKSILNGVLFQEFDKGNFDKWEEVGGRISSKEEREDLIFANLVCKHLKSNAIALVKNKQLIGKGCGQTSRIDALMQALEKSKQFKFDLKGAVLASDAFFPFDDCIKMAHQAGVTAFIQPGGSVRDKDSIEFSQKNNLAMILTGKRHFKH